MASKASVEGILGGRTYGPLGNRSDRLIARKLEAGDYETPEDVIRAGLQRLEEGAGEPRTLQMLLLEGVESGDPAPLNFDDFRDEQLRELERQDRIDSIQQ